jgi:hypothetical protein
MANETPEWITQPPAPGEVRLHVAVGEGAQISQEVRDALEQLVRAVQAEQGEEVQGFAAQNLMGGFSGDMAVKFQQSGVGGTYIKFAAPGSFSHKFTTPGTSGLKYGG